jgi:ribosomal protein S18 acetylase RimI-like enzyme
MTGPAAAHTFQRPATEWDLADLFELHRLVFRAHIDELWGWDEAWQRQRFREEFAESETTVVRAVERTVGYVQVVAEADRLFLRNIALHPDVQGQGLGARLVEEFIVRAESRDLPIVMGVFRTNPRAVAFYERLGFVRTGKTETHVRMERPPGRH